MGLGNLPLAVNESFVSMLHEQKYQRTFLILLVLPRMIPVTIGVVSNISTVRYGSGHTEHVTQHDEQNKTRSTIHAPN